MAYGLNQYSQTSDLYKNKLFSVSNQSTLGYSPSRLSPSSFSVHSSFSSSTSSNPYMPKSSYSIKPFSSEEMLKDIKDSRRTSLDRIFDGLSVFNYTTMGGIKNILDDNDSTTLLSGVWDGLKAANPFGQGYQKGEVVASDVLTELGWKPKGVVGGVAKFGTGLFLDIVTDPTTYMTLGLSGLAKGLGKVDDVVKTADSISTALKSSKGIVDDVEPIAKTFGRRVTPDDIKDIFKDRPDIIDGLTDVDYKDLAERTNRFSGFKSDMKSASIAFDFFSNKSWGFRKEFVSGETMSALGDKLGTAGLVQNIVDEVIMHPAFNNLNKNALKYQLARTDIKKLVEDLRVEDLIHGKNKSAMKANADTRKFYHDNKDKLTEDQWKVVTKNLEDVEEFYKYNKYNSIAETEEGTKIIENITKERENVVKSISSLSDMYSVHLAQKSINGSLLTKAEDKKLKAMIGAYNSESALEFIDKIKLKYAEVDDVTATISTLTKELDEMTKSQKLATKLGRKEVKQKNVDYIAEEIRKREEANALEKAVGYSNTDGDVDGMSSFNEFLRITQAIDGVSSVGLSKKYNKIVEDSFKAESATKMLATSNEIQKTVEQIKHTKYVPSPNVAKYTNENRIEESVYLPYGWSTEYTKPKINKRKNGKDVKQESMDTKAIFIKDMDDTIGNITGEKEKVITIKDFFRSHSIMHLMYDSGAEVIKKEFIDGISSISAKNHKAYSEYIMSFLEKYNPPLFKYFDSVKLVKSIYKEDSMDKFIKLLFDTEPERLNIESTKFAQNYPAVDRITKYLEVEILPNATKDTMEQLVKKAVKMYGDDVAYTKYGIKKADLIKLMNAKYKALENKILTNDDYMSDMIRKIAMEEDQEILGASRYSTKERSIAEMKKELNDDSIKAVFYSDEKSIKKVVEAILHAPESVLSAVNDKVINTSLDTIKSLTRQRDSYRKTLDTLKRDLRVAMGNKDEVSIKKIQGKLDSVTKSIDFYNNKLTAERNGINTSIRSQQISFENAYHFHMYEETKKRLINSKKKADQVKPVTANELERILAETDGVDVKSASNDAYYDMTNATELDKQIQDMQPTETTKDYENRINGFINESIDMFNNATRKAGDDMEIEMKNIKPIDKIKKTYGITDDGTAFDIMIKLKQYNLYDEIFEEGKLGITDADVITHLSNKFFEGRKISDISDKDVRDIETYVSNAMEKGYLTTHNNILVAERMSKLIKYTQKAKDVYSQLGGNVEDINKLDILMDDYNSLLKKAENGTYIWKDLHELSRVTDNIEGYEFGKLSVDDIKLSIEHNRNKEKMMQPITDKIIKKADIYLDSVEKIKAPFKYSTDPASKLAVQEMNEKLIEQQRRMQFVLDSIDNHNMADARLGDMLELRRSMDVARLEKLSNSLSYSNEYVLKSLSDFNNISEFIGDDNIKRLAKKSMMENNKILKADESIKVLTEESISSSKKIKDEIERVTELLGAKVEYDIFDNGMDRFLEDLKIRSMQLDGFIETLTSAKTTQEVDWDSIDKFLGKNVSVVGSTKDNLLELLHKQMELIVTDKTKFKNDTLLNEYQQKITLDLVDKFDEIKGLENVDQFIKNYIPHMMKDKYRYKMMGDLEFNPLSQLIGLTTEKYNKFNMSRRLSMTIEEYKQIVRAVKEGNIMGSAYYAKLQEASYSSVHHAIKNNKLSIRIPLRYGVEDVIIRTNGKEDGVLRAVGFKNSENVNYYDEIHDDIAYYLENPSFEKSDDLEKNIEMMNLVRHIDAKKGDYMYGMFQRDFADGMINKDVLLKTLDIGIDYFKRMPEDLFEENSLKLFLDRKIYSNKIIADIENAPQIKSLLCRDVVNLDDVKDSEQLVIMHRDFVEWKKSNNSLPRDEKVNTESYDGQIIFDKDRIKNNTFINLTKEQAQHLSTFPTLKNIIQVTDVSSVLQFNEAAQKQLDEGMESLLHMYDKALRLWKLNVTVLAPSFHVTNKIGSTFNSFMDIGIDVLDPNIRKSAKRILQNTEGNFVTKDGTAYNYRELLSNAIDLGVVDDGIFGADLREMMAKNESLESSKIIDFISNTLKIDKDKLVDWQKWNPLNADTFIPYKIGTEIGSAMENIDRLVNFIAHVNNGKTFGDAAEHTKKFLFDYSSSTEFEKNVLKRVFPFWSFMKNNTVLQYEMLLKKPNIYRNIAKIRNEFEAQTPYEDRLDKNKVASYARDWWQTGLQRETRTNTVDLLLNPNLPFQSLNSTNLDTVIGMISPLLKSPVELTTGKSLYSNKQIYSSKLEYLTSQTAYGSLVSKLNSSTADGKVIKLASFLVGVKIGQINESNDMLLNKDALVNNRLDKREEYRK